MPLDYDESPREAAREICAKHDALHVYEAMLVAIKMEGYDPEDPEVWASLVRTLFPRVARQRFERRITRRR